jgi:hypothetical protein
MPDYTAQFNQEKAKNHQKEKTKQKPTSPVSEITDAEFMIIGSIAAANDLCDWIGLDLLFFRLIDLGTAGVLGLWCLMRLHKFPSVRFGGTFLTELIPGLGDISPTWTLFIISIYAEQKGYLPKTLSKSTKAK